ncbi:MAG: YfhO family protein, partial [Clostridia bacterium]|nr:YfhO family protein [Clostridia bacterium]
GTRHPQDLSRRRNGGTFLNNAMDTITEPSSAVVQKPKFRLSSNAKTLLWCFFLPVFLTIVIYCCLQVWPVGKNSVLVLDLNAQYIYYFEQLRDILLSGESILYSFERALGGEFLGIFAYYLSSPFSVLVALFPKQNITEAMYLILLLKCGFCGLTFGYYLTKQHRLKPPYRVMLSVMYALSSYAVVMQHNVMWTDNLIAFPLLMLGIDELIRHGKYKLYVVSLVYAMMSNFYIGYMACLFVLIWFFIRYFMFAPEERSEHGEKNHFLRTFCRIAFWSLTALAISAIIILPVY